MGIATLLKKISSTKSNELTTVQMPNSVCDTIIQQRMT